MNKSFFILLLIGVFAYACSDVKKEENAKSEKEEKASDEKGPRKLEMVKTSELATLMRLMDAEMRSAKTSIEGGFSYHDSLTFNYGHIHSATPTEDEMKSEGFDEFATAYLAQLSNFKSSSDHNRKENFNLLVNSCITCHEAHCPGPVNKIKTLRIK